MNYKYNLPVEIIFKCGASKKIGEIIKKNNFKKGILICSERFIKTGKANDFICLLYTSDAADEDCLV